MTTATALSTLYRVGDVADPPTVEKMRDRMRSDGLVVFDGTYDIEAMLAVARRIMHITAHPDSDDRGVTTIAELGSAANQPNAGGFSRRELMPHTDRSGVPDPPGLMMLTCAVQTRVGGASRFTDGLAVHDHLAATCPESLPALSRARSALFGGAADHLGAVFTPVAGPGPARESCWTTTGGCTPATHSRDPGGCTGCWATHCQASECTRAFRLQRAK